MQMTAPMRRRRPRMRRATTRVSNAPSLDSPAACAIAWRSTAPIGDSLVPFGQLRGVMLCRHHLRDGRSPLLIKELVPTLDPRRGRCVWTSGPVVCDLSHPKHDVSDALSIKPWQSTFQAYAPVLLDAMATADSMTEPTLPYTIMSLPPGTQIAPRPTAAIQQIAERLGISWQTAWDRLHAERRLQALNDGTIRIDTRLCDRIKPGLTWPGAIGLMHDLREVPRVHAWRPPLQGSVAESLFVYQPHAIFDGWNAPEPLMQRLGMEYFPPPVVAALV